MSNFYADLLAFGPVGDSRIELPRLTVLIGPNGSGKSWFASSAFGICVAAWRNAEKLDIEGPLLDLISTELDNLVQTWSDQATPGVENRVERDISWDELLARQMPPLVLRAQPELLRDYLGELPQGFDGSIALELPIVARPAGNLPALRLRVDRREFGFTVYAQIGHSGGRGTSFEATRILDASERSRVAAQIACTLVLPFSWFHYLPVERQVAIAELSGDNRTERTPNLAIQAFRFDLSTGAALRADSKWHLAHSNIRVLPAFRRVTGRYIDVSGDGPKSRRAEEVLESGMRIAIESAASGSRALGAIELVFSGANEAGELFVIDEPELGLHPQLQMATLELLTCAVNQGHHVIVTTHSPYMVDHLTNLIAGARLSVARRDELASNLELGTADALIHADDVAIYLFEPGRPPAMVLDRDTGIVDWSTFGRVSDRVSELHNRILDLAEH